MAGMFEKKAKEASSSSTKKNEKKTIKVNDPKFDKTLQKFAELKAKMDALEAEMGLVKGELNPMGMELFVEEYEKTGAYPGSFNVETPSGASAMFIPTDKYKKLTNETFDFLSGKYDGVVTDEIEFGLNPDVLNLPGVGEKVEKALIKALGEEMTEKLITTSSTKRFIKGAIEKALTNGKGKSGKVKVSEFMTDIQPTAYFKDPRK